jgi:hypothetical protein
MRIMLKSYWLRCSKYWELELEGCFGCLFGKYKEMKRWGNPAHGVWSDLEVCKIYGSFLEEMHIKLWLFVC